MIDPRKPDFGNTPVSPQRPRFGYAPRGRASRAARAELVGAGQATADRSAAGQAGARPAGVSPAPSQGEGEVAPLVTITTAFYNAREVFRETARCVFGQSLQAWEWVIVNDGSTDPESLALLEEFRGTDGRVRVVDHAQNLGLSAARNTGFREARTPYVFQLDSDDLIEPTAVEKCLWYMHTHPEAAFVTTHVVGFQAQEYLWEKGLGRGEEFLRENLTTPMGIVRREVFEAVGTYDENNRGGMEDWEFWLRCASKGYWGQTLPEFLAWYRRRAQHWDAWENMQAEERREEFRRRMCETYEPQLKGSFPRIARRAHQPFEDMRVEPGLANPLAKESPRLLLIAPWVTLGGADKFNVAMIRELAARGWEVTVATTLGGDNSWLPEFTRLTPDVFVTPHFLHPTDVPAFLRYLIESRSPDVVMVSNSELGYHALAYLRTCCPGPAYVDLSHMEEPWWKNGGHPRYGAGSQSLLDLNIVVSEHLKRWQAGLGAEESRIEVCYVSACEDTRYWKRDPEARARVRAELGIGEEPVIIYAGRIVEQKRPRVLARVIDDLAAGGAAFTCLVAGDGPDLGWLRTFVAARGLRERVRLLGAVPHARMHELLSAGDVFFLPSMWEGIAISIYEAMSMELAVVGAAVGGQRELVTDECGVLVERGETEEEIAGYTRALASLLTDPERRERMGRAGRERIRARFEPSHMGDRIVELLAQAQRLRREEPRAEVDASFAVECARRGVEYLRAWETGEQVSHERLVLLREREELIRERDLLARQRTDLQRELIAGAHANGRDADAAEIARRIIQENMRYAAVDRINDALKSIRLHATLKALTIKVFGTRRSETPKR